MANPYLDIEKRFGMAPLKLSCQPIFILSSSWRSGSTLLQRTLCTDPSIIVWGEPYSDCNFIQSMATSTRALMQKNWPLPGTFGQQRPEIFENPHEHFIANLYPGIEAFRQSHRLFLDNVFWSTAQARQFSRFGVKFVRLGLSEAQFLRWMYPDSIFLFLIRNPWDSWRSYKGYRWRYRFPKPPVTKVETFASIWQKHTTDFLQFDLKNAGWIRYEEFIGPDFNWERLKEFCDLPNITMEALRIKIAGVNREPTPINQEEIKAIRYICGKTARKLGYTGLKKTDLSVKPFP